MKNLLIIATLVISTPAMACAPSPACYMTEGRDYLRSVCKTERPTSFDKLVERHDDGTIDTADKEQLIRDVKRYVAACKKFGINIVK
jgi:heterodisulfide reductase subunit B